MPRFDSSAVRRATTTLPRPGQVPADPAAVVVHEIGTLSDDQRVGRHVLLSWDHDANDQVPVAEWWVYVRRAGAEDFDRVAMTEHPSAVPCCEFGVGIDYEVAVVAVALEGRAHRPPASAQNRRTFRLHGREVLPGRPTGLRVLALDDRVLVTWDAVEYGAPVQYEVRIGGTSFTGAAVHARTRGTHVDLTGVIPSAEATPTAPLTIYVAAVTMTGLVGSPTALSGVSLAGADDLLVVSHADEDSWAGALTGGEVNADSELVVSDGETSATLVSGNVDTGSIDTYELVALPRVRVENVALPWSMAWFTWESAEAIRRRWEGGTEEWFPQAELARPEPPTWDDLTGTWDSYKWLTWDSFVEPRDENDPSDLTWDEADFTWDSEFAKNWTWDGPISSAGTAWAFEVSFSDDAATWSDWEAYRPQTRTFRYVRWRLVFTQPASALAVVGEGVDVFILQRRAKGQRWVDESPTGTIDGVNDDFELSSTPATGSLLVVLTGAVRRDGVDYTVSGTTITMTTPPSPGDWIQARYQH